jgi:GNAT superfamily N-acetyltransferase
MALPTPKQPEKAGKLCAAGAPASRPPAARTAAISASAFTARAFHGKREPASEDEPRMGQCAEMSPEAAGLCWSGPARSRFRFVGVEVVPVGVDRVEELVEFWKLLHRHQASVCAEVVGLAVLSEPASAEIVGEMYREWLSRPESFAFLAEDEEKPVGFVIGFYEESHFMWETGRVGHVDSFYVLPETRGQGVGRLLMEAAYAAMREAGASTVALEMVAGNEVARKFYEKEGFTTTFVQMHRSL